MFDDLHELEPGDKIDHGQWNMLVQFVKRTFSAGHYFEDESGLVVFDPPIPAGSTVVGFTLTEGMGNTTAGEASATLHKVWNVSTETYTGSEAGVVVDPGDIFDVATSGSYGKGLLRTGSDREVVDPYIMKCP